MVSSVKFGPSVPVLSTPITVSSGPGKKVKVKKMVVADPGLGMEVEIESDIPLYAVNIQIELGKKENDTVQYHHAVTYSMDGGGPALDLSGSLIFVVPFLDLNYLEEAQHTIDGTDPLYYLFNITYYPTSGVPVDFCGDGKIEKNMISVTGKFAWSHNGITIPESLPDSISSASNGFSYEKILFHELGAAYDIRYAPSLYPIGLALNNLAHTGLGVLSNIWVNDFFGQENSGEYGFCWLPYPKIQNNTPNPLAYSIQITENQIPLPNFVNLEYNLPSGFQPASGALEIEIINP